MWGILDQPQVLTAVCEDILLAAVTMDVTIEQHFTLLTQPGEQSKQLLLCSESLSWLSDCKNRITFEPWNV